MECGILFERLGTFFVNDHKILFEGPENPAASLPMKRPQIVNNGYPAHSFKTGIHPCQVRFFRAASVTGS